MTRVFSTRLSETPAAVWAHASTMAGVNAELRPLVRMTTPPRAVIGRDFTSTLLLGGLLPFDRHRLHLEALEEGRFRQVSSSLMHRRWEHERTVEPDGEGCVVTDRLRVEPRVGLLTPLVMRIVGVVFAHRHRRLAQRFGTPS